MSQLFYHGKLDTQMSLDLDIDHRMSKKAKRMALRVNYAVGRIELVTPKHISSKQIQHFLFHHQDWIKDKQKTIPQRLLFEDGVTLPLFGEKTVIHVTQDRSLKRTTIALEDGIMNVKTYLDDPSPRIGRFLKNKALTRIQDIAYPKAKRSGEEINTIRVRDTKSRWGSCSSDGQLSFSWRLIFAPVEAMDYVIAHEVAHLTHMNHAPAFWALCESLCDEYATGKSWIKKQGHTLMRYG